MIDGANELRNDRESSFSMLRIHVVYGDAYIMNSLSMQWCSYVSHLSLVIMYIWVKAEATLEGNA